GDAGTIDTPFTEVRPAILDPAARSAASTAELLLARPIAIDYHGARLGALTQLQLARALLIRARTHRYAVRFDPDKLARAARPRLGRWIRRAHNARFAVDRENVHVVPSRPGWDVDPVELATSVTAA